MQEVSSSCGVHRSMAAASQRVDGPAIEAAARRRPAGSCIARPLSTRELSRRWTALFGWKLVRKHGRPWELYERRGKGLPPE
ncbi:MAG: hypothetical protein ABIQ59_11985 [Nocardioidaceae bacterium]